MKKKALVILMAFVIAVSSVISAFAADKSGSYYYYLSLKNGEPWYLRAPYMQKFWDKDDEFPWGVSPIGNSGVLYGVNFESCNLPHQGLVLVEKYIHKEGSAGEYLYDYVTYDTQKVPIYGGYEHKFMNLNQGRFEYMYDFSDDSYGLAAAANDYWVGTEYYKQQYYVDTSGRVVITLPLDISPIYYGSQLYTGRFVDGKAIVFKDSPATDSLLAKYSGTDLDTRTLTYAYINTSGEFITDWMTASTDAEYKEILTSVYNPQGIRLVDVIFHAGYVAPEEPTGPIEPSDEPSEEKPEEKPEMETTYGQATARIKGYTIDKDYVGKMVIEITNTGNSQPDKGDLFYVTYAKFIKGSDIVDAGVYVPYQTILQIPYEVDANATTTLKIPVGFLPNYDQELTEDQIANGWNDMENVESARAILAQAETPEEAEELRTFFMKAHDYGEMGLTYEPDSDGVTILAAPYPSIERAKYLDQKLSAFISPF